MKRLNPKGIRLEREGAEVFEGGEALSPSIRRLKDLREVLLTPDFVDERNGEDPLYYMYRGPGTSGRREFGERRIRYDITILESRLLGEELNKTLGHYHALAEKGLEYPELYEVIEGEALYILQKKLADSKYDVRLVKARAGDKVMMPPNYGHITVNTGKGLLVMANLINADFDSDYQSIIRMKGGAVYVLSDRSIRPNGAYAETEVPTIEDAKKIDFLGRGSIYDQFLADPERFEFLNRPSLLEWEG